MSRIDTIIDALEEAVHNIAGDDTEEKCIAALAAACELQQANADMLSALRAIVAVAKTEDSFTMQTIKDCASIAIKQAGVTK